MRMENGRRHLTKEQLRALLFRKDGAATKHIPESTRWQMEHRPYQERGGKDNVDGRNSKAAGTVEKRRPEAVEKEI